jgi:hypothetical protein
MFARYTVRRTTFFFRSRQLPVNLKYSGFLEFPPPFHWFNNGGPHNNHFTF